MSPVPAAREHAGLPAEEALLILSPSDLRVAAANAAAADLLGDSVERPLVGQSISKLLPDVAVILQDRPPLLAAGDQPGRAALQIAFTAQQERRAGAPRLVVAMHRLADGAGGLWLVRVEREGSRPTPLAAGRDPLTGLATRAELDRYLGRHCHARSRNGRPFALVFIDLDDFKAINDTRGHLAGDRVLIAAARLLESAVRPGDLVVRFGGDEFVVLLDGIRDRKAATAVLRRMREALTTEVSASFGLALHGGGPGDPAALLAAADRAMYRNKARKASRVVGV